MSALHSVDLRNCNLSTQDLAIINAGVPTGYTIELLTDQFTEPVSGCAAAAPLSG